MEKSHNTVIISGIVAFVALFFAAFIVPVYGNLLGDKIDIVIFQNADVTTNCLSVEVTGAIECTGNLEADNLSIINIDVDVGGANGEEIRLTYSLDDAQANVPSHDILFSDLDWIDQNTGQPIVGQVIGVTCSDDFDIIHITSGDAFELTHPGGEFFTPLEIHCTILTEHEPEVLQVDIDIKPGSDPSSVSCKNTKGGVPVAIFGADNFNVSTIDLDSLQLNGVDVTEIHNKIHIEDKNGDEFSDAVIHLDKAEVCDATSDEVEYPLKESADATLTGSNADGDFEGIGDIRIVKR